MKKYDLSAEINEPNVRGAMMTGLSNDNDFDYDQWIKKLNV